MATPLTVIATPGDETSHMLFFLAGSKQQLAMQVYPVVQTQGITAYVDNNTPTGALVNPGSLSATLKNGVATVYGLVNITGTDASGKATNNTYISTVSPYLNPISTDVSAQTPGSGVAACTDQKGNNYVYYVTYPSGSSNNQITEFYVNGSNTTSAPPWSATFPEADTSLVAVVNGLERFVCYTSRIPKHGIYWVNSSGQTPNVIAGTAGVQPKSPLAMTSVKIDNGKSGAMYLVLYFMDQDQQLNRVTGVATNHEIAWSPPQTTTANNIKSSSLLTVVETQNTLYVYYMQDGGQASFTNYSESVDPSWFPAN